MVDFVVLCGMLLFGIFLNQTPVLYETSDCSKVEGEGSASSFSTRDIAGVSEYGVETDTDLNLSLSFDETEVDIDYSLDGVSEQKRLVSLPDLNRRILDLHPGEDRTVLEVAIEHIQVILKMVEDNPDLSIEALEDCTEEIVDGFEDVIIPRLEAMRTQLDRSTFGALLAMAQALVKRYKDLDYIMGKVRRYARSSLQPELTALLCQAFVASSGGDKTGYLSSLKTLLGCVAEACGLSVKENEATRIRNKVDSLLRGCRGSRREWAAEVGLATTVVGTAFHASVASAETCSLAPSEEKGTRTFALQAELEDKGGETAFEYETSAKHHPDRLKRDEDKIECRTKLTFEREDGGLLSVFFRSEKHPHAFDDEIETHRVQEVVAALGRIMTLIEALEIDPDLKEDLIEELSEEGAIGALLRGERDDAVKKIRSFVDAVNDAVFERSIEAGTAQVLVAEAENILPKEREYELDVPVEIERSLFGGTLTLMFEWEREAHPADSDLDRSVVTRAIGYTSGEGGLGFTASLAEIETLYPWAESKDKAVQKWAVEFESITEFSKTRMDRLGQLTAYPAQPNKDESVQGMSLFVEASFYGLEIRVKRETESKRYPNDPDTRNERKREVTVGLEGSVGGVSFEASSSQVEKYCHSISCAETLVQKEGVLECKFDFELGNELALFSKLEWEKREDREDATNDGWNFRIEVGCTGTL